MDYIVLLIGLSVVVGIFARSRGRSGLGWFMLSLLISPLVSGLLVLVLPNHAAIAASAPTAAPVMGNGRIDPPPLRRV